MNVEGIGEKSFLKLRDHVSVGAASGKASPFPDYGCPILRPSKRWVKAHVGPDASTRSSILK